MQLRNMIKPSALFVAMGVPAAANAATTIAVDYTATGGTGTDITIGSAASPQFNFNLQPGAFGGDKSYLNANFLNDPTARIGFPGSDPIYTSAQTSASGTFSDFATTGDYSLLFSIGSDLYSGFATVDGGGRHISSITYDVANGAVPEASTWAMMILGMGAAGVAMRRRRRQSGTALAA